MSSKRSSFTPEFKDELVKLYLEQRASKTVSQIARENGVGPETLRNWVNAYLNPDPPLRFVWWGWNGLAGAA